MEPAQSRQGPRGGVLEQEGCCNARRLLPAALAVSGARMQPSLIQSLNYDDLTMTQF